MCQNLSIFIHDYCFRVVLIRLHLEKWIISDTERYFIDLVQLDFIKIILLINNGVLLAFIQALINIILQVSLELVPLSLLERLQFIIQKQFELPSEARYSCLRFRIKCKVDQAARARLDYTGTRSLLSRVDLVLLDLLLELSHLPGLIPNDRVDQVLSVSIIF